MLVVYCWAVLLVRNLIFILTARNQELYFTVQFLVSWQPEKNSLKKNQTSSSYNNRETDHQFFKNFDLTPVLRQVIIF
jgi:hypothetical protein